MHLYLCTNRNYYYYYYCITVSISHSVLRTHFRNHQLSQHNKRRLSKTPFVFDIYTGNFRIPFPVTGVGGF